MSQNFLNDSTCSKLDRSIWSNRRGHAVGISCSRSSAALGRAPKLTLFYYLGNTKKNIAHCFCFYSHEKKLSPELGMYLLPTKSYHGFVTALRGVGGIYICYNNSRNVMKGYVCNLFNENIKRDWHEVRRLWCHWLTDVDQGCDSLRLFGLLKIQSFRNQTLFSSLGVVSGSVCDSLWYNCLQTLWRGF